MSDIADTREIDPDKLKLYSYQLFTKLDGAVTAGMIHLGDQLGLYAAMRRAGRPLSTTELAAATDTIERWVREWAFNQAASRMIEAHPDGTFSLSPEAAVVLADHEHPAFGMGMFHRLPADDEGTRARTREFSHRRRPRLRQPRSRGCGGHRAQLRAVEPQLPGARGAARSARE